MPAIDVSRPLRVALARFGHAGQCHARTWAAMPGVAIVGVYSLRPDAEAADIAAACGADVPVFSDYRKMLDRTGWISCRSAPRTTRTPPKPSAPPSAVSISSWKSRSV
jgi:predicted dehydrogenase